MRLNSLLDDVNFSCHSYVSVTYRYKRKSKVFSVRLKENRRLSDAYGWIRYDNCSANSAMLIYILVTLILQEAR